jgi:hypothetical protein
MALWALSNGPTIVSVVSDIIGLVKKLPRKDAAEIQKSASEAVIADDTEKLIKVKKRCEGIACPMETKHE